MEAGLRGGRMSEDLYLACWLSIYLPGAAFIINDSEAVGSFHFHKVSE